MSDTVMTASGAVEPIPQAATGQGQADGASIKFTWPILNVWSEIVPYVAKLATTEDTSAVKGSIVRLAAINALTLYEVMLDVRQATGQMTRMASLFGGADGAGAAFKWDKSTVDALAAASIKAFDTMVQPQFDKLRADLKTAQDKQAADEAAIGNLQTTATAAQQEAQQQNARIVQNEERVSRLFEREYAVAREVRELTDENLPFIHQELSEAHDRLAGEQERLAARMVELAAELARVEAFHRSRGGDHDNARRSAATSPRRRRSK